MSRRLIAFSVLAALLCPSLALGASPRLRDVTEHMAVTGSGFRLDRRTGELVQAVTITNKGERAISGRFYIQVTGLDKGVALNRLTESVLGVDGLIALAKSNRSELRPGGRITQLLRFKAAQGSKIKYTTRVLSEED